ncbi:MAG TPA: hypothetical protein VF272_02015 [Candidatus Saccharimonadia bacterium]
MAGSTTLFDLDPLNPVHRALIAYGLALAARQLPLMNATSTAALQDAVRLTGISQDVLMPALAEFRQGFQAEYETNRRKHKANLMDSDVRW